MVRLEHPRHRCYISTHLAAPSLAFCILHPNSFLPIYLIVSFFLFLFLETLSKPPTMSRTYFPSTSKFAEDPDRYHKNALHPLLIGDVLENGRYRIVHKLGSGSFATVWLARDTVNNAYVSLKVMSANTPPESQELRILQQIRDTQLPHPGKQFVVQLRDSFTVDGPNGKHTCLVTDVAGDRLARPDDLPYGDLAWPRMVGLQIAQALGYLHALGIAHAGESSSSTLDVFLPMN